MKDFLFRAPFFYFIITGSWRQPTFRRILLLSYWWCLRNVITCLPNYTTPCFRRRYLHRHDHGAVHISSRLPSNCHQPLSTSRSHEAPTVQRCCSKTDRSGTSDPGRCRRGQSWPLAPKLQAWAGPWCWVLLVAATTGLGAELRVLQAEQCVGTVRLCCASNGGMWVGVEVWLHLFLTL